MNVMNSMIIILVIILNVVFVQCKAKTDIASLSYVYKYKIKTTQDNAQIIFQVSNKNDQLSNSYEKIQQVISVIRRLTQNYCQYYKLEQESCNTTLEVIDQETKTLYKVINNQKMIFSSFLLKQKLKIKVINAKKVAHLTDLILKISQDILMVSFNWLSQNEDQLFELALKAGVQQGFKLCEQIHGQLQKVVRVEQIADFEVQQLQQEQQQLEQQEKQVDKEEDNQTNQQQEQQENIKPTIEWKFQVLCKIN